MNENESWFEKIEKVIVGYRFLFSMIDPSENPMDTLLRVARRIDKNSSECLYCEEYKKEIEEITRNFETIKNLPTAERKRPFKRMKPVIRHLQKEHKLVVHNQYVKIGIVAGLAGGAVPGLIGGIIFKNPLIGIMFGMVIGIFAGMKVGTVLESRASKEKRLL